MSFKKRELKMVYIRPREYDSVTDKIKGMFSAVSVIPYHHTKGIMMRDSGTPKLIGYCRESPDEVLETFFPDYHVTFFNGFHFFDSGDFGETTPMVGLGINPIKPPAEYGIEYNGTLAGILEIEEVSRLKREQPLSSEDFEKIIKYLDYKDTFSRYSKGYKQFKFNQEQAIYILNRAVEQKFTQELIESINRAYCR